MSSYGGGGHAPHAGGDGLSSFLSLLKRCDVYRTVPADHLTQQTTVGSIVSLVSGLLIALLFLSEFIQYLSVDTRHEMFVEHPHRAVDLRLNWLRWRREPEAYEEEASQVKINFNVTLPRMPCAIVAVGMQDVLGDNIDLRGRIHKYRTDADGQLKFASGSVTPNPEPLSGDYGTPQEQVGEGCQVDGHVLVKKVPGNLHFSSNAHPNILALFMHQQAGPGATGAGGNLNTSHVINDLWFGESTVLRDAGIRSALAPLNGGTKWSRADEVSNGNEKSYEYYLKVIPTEYVGLRGPPVSTYQYVSNSNEIVGRFRMPTIFFRYDFEPCSRSHTRDTHTTATPTPLAEHEEDRRAREKERETRALRRSVTDPRFFFLISSRVLSLRSRSVSSGRRVVQPFRRSVFRRHRRRRRRHGHCQHGAQELDQELRRSDQEVTN